MGGQSNRDPIVDVGPLRVMIHALGNNGDLGHAQGVLDGFLASRGSLPKAGPWKCTQCGAEVDAGFDICWQCGAARK